MAAHSIFTEAAVMVNRSRMVEKRYEDYKKSQEARIYNYPGPDARLVLVDKLLALRTSSYEQNEHLTRIITDLGSLPSHHLSDVVAYNESNHVTEDALAEEKRKAAMAEVDRKLTERHECADRNLVELQARLDELAKEREAREIVHNLPPPIKPHKVAVEAAAVVHEANVQRVATVEVRTCVDSSVSVVYFTEFRSLEGFRANHHLCRVNPPQGRTDRNLREITPDHGWPSFPATRVR